MSHRPRFRGQADGEVSRGRRKGAAARLREWLRKVKQMAGHVSDAAGRLLYREFNTSTAYGDLTKNY